MARGYYRGGGLGDLASVGQGLLGGAGFMLDTGTRLRALQMQEDEAERRARGERLGTRLKAFEIGAKHPEYADQLPAIFGGEGDVPDFGPQFSETAAKVREADKAISDFVVSGDLKPLLAAGTANPFVGQRLKGNEKALAAVKDARELMTNQEELQALQADAAKLMQADPSLDRAEAVRRAAAGNARRVALLEKGHRALLPPELTPAQRLQYDPRLQGDIAGAREFGRVLGGARAGETPLDLADVYDRATTPAMGGPLRLRGFFGQPEAPAAQRAPTATPAQGDQEQKFQAWYASWAEKLGLNPNPDDPRHQYDYRAAFRAGAAPNEEGHWPSQFKAPDHPNRFVGGVDTITGQPAPAPLRLPGRTPNAIAVDVAGRKAAARVTPEERQRIDLQRQRNTLYGRDVATREGQLARQEARDTDIKARIGATLKTFEALAIDTAKKAFPDDPVKQMALAEKLRDRLRGLGSLMASDKDAAQIEQEIRDEIAKAKGEFQAALPEAKDQVGSYWSRLWDAVKGGPARKAMPGRGAPAPRPPASTPTPRPAPAPAALKAARDAMVNALYPGRPWAELNEEEKQAVAERLSPEE